MSNVKGVLFHGSDAEFKIILPKKLSVQSSEHTDRVYATPSLAFASIFTMPRKYKFFQGFSGRVRTKDKDKIFTILPRNIILNKTNISNLEKIVEQIPESLFTPNSTPDQKATQIIVMLNEFYEILKTKHVYIYSVNANQFEAAKHNSELEYFATSQVPIIESLTKPYNCAMSAMASTGVSLYEVDFETFLKMCIDGNDETKQSEYRTRIFESQPVNLAKYKEIYANINSENERFGRY